MEFVGRSSRSSNACRSYRLDLLLLFLGTFAVTSSDASRRGLSLGQPIGVLSEPRENAALSDDLKDILGVKTLTDYLHQMIAKRLSSSEESEDGGTIGGPEENDKPYGRGKDDDIYPPGEDDSPVENPEMGYLPKVSGEDDDSKPTGQDEISEDDNPKPRGKGEIPEVSWEDVNPKDVQEDSPNIPDGVTSLKVPGESLLSQGEGFHWQACDPKKYPLHVSLFNVDSHPFPLKGDITFSIHMDMLETLEAPMKMVVYTAKKQMGNWVKVDCNGYWGSCEFEDICHMLDAMKTCPRQMLRKMPCKCPFEKGHYEINDSKIRTNLKPYARGTYFTSVVITHHQQSIACYKAIYRVE